MIRTLLASLFAVLVAPAVSAGGDFDTELLAEINFARTQPTVYAGIVAERGGKMGNSGKAIHETVRYMQKRRPMSALTLSQGLTRAALSHVLDTGARGTKGHVGSDGSRVDKRADRFGRWDGLVGENICYGRGNARDVIVCLIIDEGVSGKYHRKNIFGNFRYVGVASGRHSTMGLMVVTDFAAKYTEGGRGVATR